MEAVPAWDYTMDGAASFFNAFPGYLVYGQHEAIMSGVWS